MANTARTHYIYLDIVSFTKGRSVEAQSDVVERLKEIVRTSVANPGVPACRVPA